MKNKNPNLSQMQDTKWHIGYVTKEEDDPRRDKRRCIYYRDGKCKFAVTCPGSSHCQNYYEGYIGSSPVYNATDEKTDAERARDMIGRTLQHTSLGRGRVIESEMKFHLGMWDTYIKVQFRNSVEYYKYPQVLYSREIRFDS